MASETRVDPDLSVLLPHLADEYKERDPFLAEVFRRCDRALSVSTEEVVATIARLQKAEPPDATPEPTPESLRGMAEALGKVRDVEGHPVRVRIGGITPRVEAVLRTIADALEATEGET